MLSKIKFFLKGETILFGRGGIVRFRKVLKSVSGVVIIFVNIFFSADHVRLIHKRIPEHGLLLRRKKHHKKLFSCHESTVA